MSEVIEKVFIIEVAVRIEVVGTVFPDQQATEIVEKVKTKILANRESMTLVGMKNDVFEVAQDEED